MSNAFDSVIGYEKIKRDFIMRVFIAVFIVISAVIAINQVKNKSLFIAQMMGVSWGALAGAFLVPFLYGLYCRKVTKASVAASFIWGTGLEIIQFLISLNVFSAAGSPLLSFVFRNSIYSGSFAMLGGLIIVPLVGAFIGSTLPEGTDEIFRCYDENLTVKITENLGK